MKKMICVILSLLLLAASGAWAEESADLMTPEALQQRLDSSPYINLLDVRDIAAYEEAHIPYASSFPLDELKAEMEQVLASGFSAMGTEITVYGDTEEMGIEAAAILRELGFNNVWRLSSMDAWTGKLISAAQEMCLLGGLDTQDIYGNAVDVSLLAGHKLTMVNVWATYCGPCINEMSDLGKLARDLKSEGVQVIGLVSDVVGASFKPDESQVEQARKIVEQTNADYPHLLPSKDLYWKVIGQIEAVPTTFFVDETGMMVGYAYVGARSYDAWKKIAEDMLTQVP